MPEDIATLVETYLQQSPGRRSSSEGCEERLIQPSLQLDIWDYGGHPDLTTGHLLGLIDHRAVNLVLFDLRQELDSPAGSSSLTQLEVVQAWLCLLHLTSRTRARAGLSCEDQPQPHIIIVGTHSHGLSSDQVEVSLQRIRRSLEGQPYQASVSQTIFSLDSLSLSHSTDIR